MTLVFEFKKSLPNTSPNRFATCLDDISTTIANLASKEYHFMNVDSWRFDYPVNGASLEELQSITRLNRPDIVKNLNNYHGIKIQRYYYEDFSELLDKVSKNLTKNQPTIVHFDSYYWTYVNKLDTKNVDFI